MKGSLYARNVDGCPVPKITHQLLVEVIEWSSDAAREAVVLDRFHGEPTSEDFGMGLWQSFQDKFPKRLLAPAVDYDIMCTALSATYRATVRALLATERTKDS